MLTLDNQISRLRITGFLEAVSWLVLLFIAMPLKYFAGEPLMVKYTGWVHGILFILYIIQLLNAWSDKRWKIPKLVKGGVAALLPFGTLIFDKELRNE